MSRKNSSSLRRLRYRQSQAPGHALAVGGIGLGEVRHLTLLNLSWRRLHRYHATRYVKKEAAGSLNLDLVRDIWIQVEPDQRKTF